MKYGIKTKEGWLAIQGNEQWNQHQPTGWVLVSEDRDSLINQNAHFCQGAGVITMIQMTTEELITLINVRTGVTPTSCGANADWVNRCWHLLGDKVNGGKGLYLFEEDFDEVEQVQRYSVICVEIDHDDVDVNKWLYNNTTYDPETIISDILEAQLERSHGEW